MFTECYFSKKSDAYLQEIIADKKQKNLIKINQQTHSEGDEFSMVHSYDEDDADEDDC